MKKYQLIQLNGDTCAGCVENFAGIQSIIETRNDLEFIEVGDLHAIKQLVERYHLTHLPALLLVQGNDLLGEVHGYQPLEILSYWIDAKMDEDSKKDEEK